MEEQAMKFEEKLKALVEMGKKKKNILEIQEINDVFSDMELEAEQMDKIFEYQCDYTDTLTKEQIDSEREKVLTTLKDGGMYINE